MDEEADNDPDQQNQRLSSVPALRLSVRIQLKDDDVEEGCPDAYHYWEVEVKEAFEKVFWELL